MVKGFFNRIWVRRFLRQGRQSGNIEFIRQRASQFSGSNTETIGQILGFVKKMGKGNQERETKCLLMQGDGLM